MGRPSSYTFVLVLASTMIMLCHRASSVSCDFTKYPDLCQRTLATSGSSSSSTPHVIDTLYDLINVTLSRTNLRVTSKYVDMLTSRFTSHQARLARNAIRKCHNLMRMSGKSLKKSMKALRKESFGNVDKEDIQTWLSATITYQQACMEAVGPHMATNAYLSRLHKRMEHLSMLSSNPLTLVNRLMVGGHGRRRRLLSFPGPGGMEPDVVVAKDGSGDFTTVGEAIEKASGVGRFVIYVKTGKYEEKVKVDKDFVTLIGDGMFSSIITSDGSVDKGYILGDTATFIITGDHFMAQDIGFFNTAGPQAAQALALSVASDQSVFHRCSIASYQDTLYALSNRQFYIECRIYGTIDFIFGNAAAVFQNSIIVLRRPLHGASNVIMANGRTSSDQNTGFVLHNCSIVAGRELVPVQDSYVSYLGRPWKEYSRAVVMQSYIDAAISGEGWIMWQWASYYGTLYFAEYGNVGPGSGTQGRVSWPGYHVLGADEAMQFTVGSFIGGDSWLPSMGVGFISGLQ